MGVMDGNMLQAKVIRCLCVFYGHSGPYVRRLMDEQVVERQQPAVADDRCIDNQANPVLGCHGRQPCQEGHDQDHIVGQEAGELARRIHPTGPQQGIHKIHRRTEEHPADHH